MGGRENFSSPPFSALSLQSLPDFELELPSSSSALTWAGWLRHYLSSAQVPLGSLCPQLPGSGNGSLRQQMNPPYCGYFTSFPFVHFQEPVVPPGNRPPRLAGVLTRERPKSLQSTHCKSWTLSSRTTLLPHSQGFTLVIPRAIQSCLARLTAHEHGASSFSTPRALQKSRRGAAVKPFLFHLGRSLLCLPKKGVQPPGCRHSPASQRPPRVRRVRGATSVRKEALGRSAEHCELEERKEGTCSCWLSVSIQKLLLCKYSSCSYYIFAPWLHRGAINTAPDHAKGWGRCCSLP